MKYLWVLSWVIDLVLWGAVVITLIRGEYMAVIAIAACLIAFNTGDYFK